MTIAEQSFSIDRILFQKCNFLYWKKSYKRNKQNSAVKIKEINHSRGIKIDCGMIPNNLITIVSEVVISQYSVVSTSRSECSPDAYRVGEGVFYVKSQGIISIYMKPQAR